MPVDDAIPLPTPEATGALGAAIAALLRPGDAVCLSGPLGAGKSVLARGLVRALTSPEEEVPSPTFTLIQFYVGAGFPLAHLDLYRLKTLEEAYELGLDEALEIGAAVIEWPERLGCALPPDRLEVALEPDPAAPDSGTEGGRVARLSAFGSWIGRADRLHRPPLADPAA